MDDIKTPARRPYVRRAPRAVPASNRPSVHESGRVEMPAAAETSAPVASAPPVIATVAEMTKSKDIGSWTFTPWKKVPMWTHKATGRTSFNEAEVRKLRRL